MPIDTYNELEQEVIVNVSWACHGAERLAPRRHLLFVEMVRERLRGASFERQRGPSAASAERVGSGTRPADLPVVGPADAY